MNKKYFYYSAIGFSVLYVLVGLYLIFIDTQLIIKPLYKYLFGGFIIVYGIFRAIRAMQMMKRNV
ncbi:MAG: hypothetical protein IPO27_08050 [Bacteroidetes bacterium]|nr:hypothetical protein [Bacteroidota bacterium]